jgi:hypothetical protein
MPEASGGVQGHAGGLGPNSSAGSASSGFALAVSPGSDDTEHTYNSESILPKSRNSSPTDSALGETLGSAKGANPNGNGNGSPHQNQSGESESPSLFHRITSHIPRSREDLPPTCIPRCLFILAIIALFFIYVGIISAVVEPLKVRIWIQYFFGAIVGGLYLTYFYLRMVRRH